MLGGEICYKGAAPGFDRANVVSVLDVLSGTARVGDNVVVWGNKKPGIRVALKRVYDAELKALGDMADSVDVTVGEDKIHGSMATLTIKVAPQVSENEINNKIIYIINGLSCT